MWEVKNHTPFSALGSFERDQEGREVWCVAVRARFDVQSDGSVTVAESQTDVKLAPEYEGEGCDELLADEDIVPFRQATDVLVRGVLTPPEKPLTSIPLRLQVGSLAKEANWLGLRKAKIRGGSAELFLQSHLEPVRLSWRMAYGGIDLIPDSGQSFDQNPIGVGFCSKPLKNIPNDTEFELPQIESMSRGFSRNNSDLQPVGFGPVQRFWQPRLSCAGRFDDTWEKTRQPLLPVDFDRLFYQSAPHDQVYAGRIVGGEEVRLSGFNPKLDIPFQIPKFVFRAKTLVSGKPFVSEFKCQSLEFFVDAGAIEMMWNTHVPCSGLDQYVARTIVTMKQHIRAS